eukprot:jgi/Tetstr1/465889/TSEL_010506.t1
MASRLCRAALAGVLARTRAPHAGVGALLLPPSLRSALPTGLTGSRQLTVGPHKPWFSDLISSQEETPITVRVGEEDMQINTEALRGVADGAALVAQGSNCMLGTVLVNPSSGAFPGARANFRFEVEYRERACAFGRIPTTATRREGAPRDREVVVMNLMENVFRPLLAPGYSHDTTLEALTLASDAQGDPVVLAVNAISSALSLSNVPWAGPVGAVRLALDDVGELQVNPPRSALATARASLLYVGTSEGPVLLSGEGAEVAEEELIRLAEAGHAAVGRLVEVQRGFGAPLGAEGGGSLFEVAGSDLSAQATVESLVSAQVEQVLRKSASVGSLRTSRALAAIKSQLRERLVDLGVFRLEHSRKEGSGAVAPTDIDAAVPAILAKVMRRMLLEEGLRPGGQGPQDALPMTVKKNFLPGVHGSSLLGLGDGQVLTTVTVGREEEKPFTDHVLDFGTMSRKPLVVQYDAAASRQLTRTDRSMTKREQIFTSSFIESALRPVLPSEADFPFAVRVNIEVLGTIWVPDATAVTGASLALRQGAVPLARPVVGVTVGLVPDGTAEPAFELINDVSELEQGMVGATVQLAGTREGATALHLACEEGPVPLRYAIEAIRFAQQRRAPLAEAIEAYTEEVMDAGPVVSSRSIKKDYIGKLIGPMGATIKKLCSDTACVVGVSDTATGGLVSMYAPSAEAHARLRAALDAILPFGLEQGKAYRARVVTLKDYGVFVELPNKEQALLHVSEFDLEKVKNVTDVFKLDDLTEVLYLGVDAKGLTKLSRRALLLQRQKQQQEGAAAAGNEATAE